MNFEIKAKRKDTGKWWGFGRISKNQYGNDQIGMKVTQELLDYIAAHPIGTWINFSLFEPKMPIDEVGAGYKKIAANLENDLSDEVPF